MTARAHRSGLTVEQRDTEVLRELKYCYPAWVTPMDVGGFDASHHSKTLARLVKSGLVEKTQRDGFQCQKAHWKYRLTEDPKYSPPKPKEQQ